MKNLLLALGLTTSFISSAQLNLQWQEIGPDNMGGNVKALIFDRRDASRQTLYAGATAGGVWKTTNGGDWWNFLGCTGNYAVSCMVQASDGTIYFGTGEGIISGVGSSFSLGHTGNGIYKLDTQDNISHLLSTTANGHNDKWAGINQLAVNPNNPNQLIAATQRGLYKSTDGGATWDTVSIDGVDPWLSACDVKWANNGSLIFATAGGNKKLVRSINGGLSWERISDSLHTGFPPIQSRIEIAIAPTNSNIAYISVATTAGATYGVWKTADAGNTWDTIMRKNGSFDPFSDVNQGWYTNAIAVSPVDSNRIFVGGAYMYSYSPTTGMRKVTNVVDPYIDSNSFLDQFGYAINDINPDEAYFYSNRGIYKSYDADVHFSAPTFYAKHAGLKARDFFSVAASKSGKVIGGSNLGRGTMLHNSSSLNFTKLLKSYSSFCDVSHLDTNVIFSISYFAKLYTSFNFGNTFRQIEDDNIDPQHYGEPSRCGGQLYQNSAYISPFFLCETKSAYNTRDSVAYTSSASYVPGDTIHALSKTAHTAFNYTLATSLTQGETIQVPDAVQSRLFLPSNCGLWMKFHALDTSSRHDWFRISNYLSGVIRSITTTKSGNTVYAGNTRGMIYKITGLNFINYSDSLDLNKADSLETTFAVVDSLRPIEGIAIDPNNDSTLICTIAGFDNLPNVYKSINAGQTWFPIQAGPTGVPAYTCVIDANNSNNYFVGTEHGIWSSSDAGTNWNADNGDMCDVPVYRLRQIPLLEDNCMVLYAATNSRGLWRSFTLTPSGCNTTVGINEQINSLPFSFITFPNPVSTQLNIEFDLPNAQQVEINLLDIQGKKLQSTKLQFAAGKQIHHINTSQLTSGIYLVQLKTKDFTSVQKIIVENK